MSIRNTCSQAIDISWIRPSETLGSEAQLNPGQSTNIGLSNSEISEGGGLSFAVCKGGYRAVGANGYGWRGGSFYCKRI